MSLSSPPPFASQMTDFALDTYMWLGPIAGPDPQNGWALAAICGGIGEMFREVEEVVRARPGRDPFEQAFDIDVCPDFLLPWFGQFVGVRVTPRADASAQRDQVRAEAGFGRGRPKAMADAISPTLTGSRRMVFRERSADAWTLTIITEPGETPSVAQSTAAAVAAKPAGIVLTMLQTSSPFWFQGTRLFTAAPNTMASATLAQVT